MQIYQSEGRSDYKGRAAGKENPEDENTRDTNDVTALAVTASTDTDIRKNQGRRVASKREAANEKEWPEIALLSRRVTEAREEANLTQLQLAERIGIDRAWITNLENRKINPTLQSVIAVARALNRPMTYFFEPNRNKL